MRELALQCYVAFSMSVSKLSCMWQFIMANEYMRYLLWFVCACHCNSVHAPDYRFQTSGGVEQWKLSADLCSPHETTLSVTSIKPMNALTKCMHLGKSRAWV